MGKVFAVLVFFYPLFFTPNNGYVDKKSCN
jgi:hypothetical protein